MAIDIQFHRALRSLTVEDAAHLAGIEIPRDGAGSRSIASLAPASDPTPNSLVFIEKAGPIDAERLAGCTAILCRANLTDDMPQGPAILVAQNPRTAFQDIALALFPGSLGDALALANPQNATRHPSGALISPSARLEDQVILQPGVVIGDDVQIGRGSVVGANSVIAQGCRIGREARIGPNVSVQYALIGDRVTVLAGAMIGQDGFGFVPRANGLRRMPQLGRVVVQDDVEIGAGTAIDRGTLGDTVIGQGTKIDNLVQIGHNVRIGMHTVIAGQCAIAGSVTIGDGCMIGGGVGIADQLTVGAGAQLAGGSGVMTDIPAGERWGGAPALPVKQVLRQIAALRRLANDRKSAR